MTPYSAPRYPVSVNLRLWLPIALACVGLLAFALLMHSEWRSYDARLSNFVNYTARDGLLQAKRNIEMLLRREEGANLVRPVSELGLDPVVRNAVLIDENGVVLAATRFAWRYKVAAQVVPDYPAATVQTVMMHQRLYLAREADQHSALGVMPITMSLRSGELRAQRTGVLLVQYDLRPLAAEAWQRVRHQALIFLLSIAGAALTLLMFAQWFIMRPVKALLSGMTEIGAGNFDSLPVFRGRGEFSALSRAMSKMAAALKKNVRELRHSEDRFRQLSDAAFEAIVLHDGGRILDVNGAFEVLFKRSAAQLIGTSIYAYIPEEEQEASKLRGLQRVEGTWMVRMQDAEGEIFPCEIKARSRVIDGRNLRIIVIRDVRARLEAEQEIRRLSYSDPVTGLPNRRSLQERVEDELASHEGAEARRSALVAINLDGFASINDSLGMKAGDVVLREVAHRLLNKLSASDLLARVEADTFGVLLCGLTGDVNEASLQASRATEILLAAIVEPLDCHGHVLHVTAGAGIVMIPNDSREAQELLREAETAMHLAKETGSSQVCFFAHNLQEMASERLRLRSDLKIALREGGQFQLHYQPQVNSSGALLGVEALLRWQHPVRGMVSPLQFIPEAEASGLIVELGQWVLGEAAACLRRLRNELPSAVGERLCMAINVSPRQFREADFVAKVEEVLAEFGKQLFSIELELTESVVADNLDATLKKMEQLHKHGIQFALDDFGTGYSSLSYLKYLPIDTLKIDRSFVMDIDADQSVRSVKRPAVLIEAIVKMAHQLGMTVLAEGVETQAQLEWLVYSGCDKFQGYYFSRPLTEAALIAFALQANKDPA
ncbi:Hypothetical protein HDN1F_27270 [gamma proteobacterium HdN1]|nr:Hypothetical protein HDN1F_27270 [gamma proteobacterium HdN1]